MNDLSKDSVAWVDVGDEDHDQRVDNYLIRRLKGVPKSHIYRILRSGEVRVNSRRVEPTYRLRTGDRVRIPPVRTAAPAKASPAPGPRLADRPLYEDEVLLAIDKPAGKAVHGGSGISLGVIEQLRRERPQLRFLELVHRLDRDTSGVLLLAKKRAALVELHRQLREGEVEKRYLTLVKGVWRENKKEVSLPLNKYVTAEGERRVSVRREGLPSRTIFNLRGTHGGYSLLEAELKTGRTHQIRVHLAHLGYPIAGDDKYGDFALNKSLGRSGLKRMFLHAHRIAFRHPVTGERLTLDAPLPQDLRRFLKVADAEAV
ncbi:MAG: RluA family pseudouridine synthase [Betaproteobacteria bacterium]|nr:RluA family pseudouridine synthase [Betaproteobacteria bacterium]